MPSCAACAFDAPDHERTCPRCGGALADPLVGTVLGDRYRIVSRIGAGGMGAVYLAEHTMMKRDVAIKVLLPEFGGKDEFVRRFEREAQSASRLAHPNIITVTDFGRTADGLLFLAMEYLDGDSLTTAIRRGPMPLPRGLTIARQILDALEHAHGAGVVHRDLKPDNIMLLERDGRADIVKILDFGIAKVTEPTSGREALTQAGVIFGTPEYLSPEQALGEVVDARADVYAAGVILYEMLTGRRPYESEDKVRVISMHLSHPVPPMRERNPAVSVPEPVEEAVLQALEKHREHRFASAAAFRAALEDARALVASGAAAMTPAPSPDGGLGALGASAAGGAATPPPVVAPAPSPQLLLPLSPASPAPTLEILRRLRDRRAWAAAAIGVVVLAAAVIAIGTRRGGAPAPGGGDGKTVARDDPRGAATRPAPSSATLAAQLRRAEGQLAAGELTKARLALDQLLAENPENARVRYLRGRLVFAEGRHAEALSAYREAIALDGGLRSDPVLLEHVAVAATEPRIADEAVELAIEKIGRPALPTLERVANGSGDLARRQRAARALDELGEGKRVDRVELLIAELKKAPACEDKRPLVLALGDSGDVRALPALRAQRPRGGLSRLLGSEPDSACMKTELADAIAKLEAKLPPDKQRPAQRSTARRGFMRGR